MTTLEAEVRGATRKRFRSENSAEEAAASARKTRGRPRVDAQDATAADVGSYNVLNLPR